MESVKGVRGQTLVNARMFCLDRFGEDGWKRVRDAMKETSVITVENAERGRWYPVNVYVDVHDAIARVLGEGNPEFRVMVDLGYYAANYDVTKTMQLFLRVATPAFLMRGYTQMWGSYHGTGSWEVVKEGPRRLRANLTGWRMSSEAACVSVAAWVERFLQLVGGHDARVTRTLCAQRGDASCEYLCEWQSAPSK